MAPKLWTHRFDSPALPPLNSASSYDFEVFVLHQCKQVFQILTYYDRAAAGREISAKIVEVGTEGSHLMSVMRILMQFSLIDVCLFTIAVITVGMAWVPPLL